MKMKFFSLTILVLLNMITSVQSQEVTPTGPSTGPAEVAYGLEMPEPSNHIYHVSVTINSLTSAEEFVDLVMPVWRPGRYVVLDFAGGVLRFEATDAAGHRLNWEKMDKSTWRVYTVGVAGFTARYEVYADEFNIRTRGLDAGHGFIDGTAVFMYSQKYRNLPVRLTVKPATGWHVTTGLEGNGNVFTSPGYDHFVDCPIEIGTQQDFDFVVRGVPHVLSVFGSAEWDPDTVMRDLAKIVEVTADFWGDIPYSRFVFMVHIAPWAGGATEHFNSTIIGGRPDRVVTPDGYRGFLSTAAHEYFHTWNAKRLRPKGIVPYDYTRENYLKELWIAEGMTSYFDDLLLVRAGLQTPAKYVKSRASWVSGDRRKPGNLAQSLSESSFDAWIKFNRRQAHSYNTQTNFYSKGSQVSFMLDMTIRRLTDNDHSLDEVMRLMYGRFPFSGPGYTVDDLQATASEVAGTDLSEFFTKYVHGTDPLPWEEMLAVAGITVAPKDTVVKPWIGLAARKSGGRSTVSTIADGSPASESGLDIGDELVALDGVKWAGRDLKKVVSAKSTGDTLTFSVFRDNLLRELSLTVRESPVPDYETTQMDDPSDLQKKTYEEWLKTSWE